MLVLAIVYVCCIDLLVLITVTYTFLLAVILLQCSTLAGKTRVSTTDSARRQAKRIHVTASEVFMEQTVKVGKP